MKALFIRTKRLKQLNVHKQNKKNVVDKKRWSITQSLKGNFHTNHNMNESYAKRIKPEVQRQTVEFSLK